MDSPPSEFQEMAHWRGSAVALLEQIPACKPSVREKMIGL